MIVYWEGGKKKDCLWDSPQTSSKMYVLAKMTEQRALIAVMTHRQLHVFHKWELEFQTKIILKQGEP